MSFQLPADLEQHLAAADAIVVGTVSAINLPDQEVRQLTAPQRPWTPITEHDPKWREATIQIGSALKGDLAQGTATVMFMSSDDVANFRAPKLHVGQKGIFVLHQRDIPELQRTEYVALHPEDYHPPERLPQIQMLMGGGG